MRDPVHFIPLVTTVVAAFFAPIVYRRWLQRQAVRMHSTYESTAA